MAAAGGPMGVMRDLVITVHPWEEHTTITLITVDRIGRRRWDRKLGTWDFPTGRGDLAGMPLGEVLGMVANAIIRPAGRL